MARTQAKKKKGIGWKLLAALIVVVMIGYAVYYFVYNEAVDKATEQVTEQVLADSGQDSSQAQQILDSMSTEDRDTVEGIVEDHATLSNVQKAQQYISSGDTEGLKEFARSQLSQDEINQLYQIYQQYYQ